MYDNQLEIIPNAGIIVDKGKIVSTGDYSTLKQKAYEQKIADIAAFKTNDYREIICRQGKLRPTFIWKNGEQTSPVPKTASK